MGRIVRIVLLVILLATLAIVVWMRVTPAGREVAGELANRWQGMRHGGNEKEAAEKLTALGARMARSAPPDDHYVSIDCKDKTLGDEGFRLVGQCFFLETAAFINCDVNDEAMRHLAGLPHLTSLTIYKSPAVTDAGIQHVAALQELASLLIKGTQVSDAGLVAIAKIPDLKVLDLTHTRITDAGMATLSGMGSLEWLLLEDTEITDAGLAKLDGLRNLKQISLGGTKVTDEGRAQLKRKYRGLKIE